MGSVNPASERNGDDDEGGGSSTSASLADLLSGFDDARHETKVPRQRYGVVSPFIERSPSEPASERTADRPPAGDRP